MSTLVPGGAPDKYAAVNRMFGRIARRYDLMNALMTLGLDRHWRRLAARAAALPEGGLALDVGTGTGDLACELARATPGAHVVGLDYTSPMLARAPGKALRGRVDDRTGWVRADGLRLPFPDETFHAITSAFVLRNFTDLDAAFSEMARVARPSGRVVALEISPTGSPVWRPLFDLYFHRIVPQLGSLITGDRTAYDYLPSSVAAFLSPGAVADRMEEAGLMPQMPIRLLLGSVVIHIGAKRPTVGQRD